MSLNEYRRGVFYEDEEDESEAIETQQRKAEGGREGREEGTMGGRRMNEEERKKEYERRDLSQLTQHSTTAHALGHLVTRLHARTAGNGRVDRVSQQSTRGTRFFLGFLVLGSGPSFLCKSAVPVAKLQVSVC